MKKQGGRIQYRAVFLVFADADAVHDDQDNRAFPSEEFRIAFQGLNSLHSVAS